MRPWNSISTGTRRSVPSASGTALRNPDAPAARASGGRLQIAPRGVEHRRVDRAAAGMQDRQADRVQHAIGARRPATDRT